MHPVDGTDQGGFTGAGQTNNGYKLPLFNGEIDVLERLIPIEIGLADMVEYYHRETS